MFSVKNFSISYNRLLIFIVFTFPVVSVYSFLHLRKQRMCNVNTGVKQKGARAVFIFLKKKLGTKPNIYDGITFYRLIYLKRLTFHPEKKYVVSNDD